MPFLSLPTEIHLEIMKLLSQSDLLTLTDVCEGLRKIATDVLCADLNISGTNVKLCRRISSERVGHLKAISISAFNTTLEIPIGFLTALVSLEEITLRYTLPVIEGSTLSFVLALRQACPRLKKMRLFFRRWRLSQASSIRIDDYPVGLVPIGDPQTHGDLQPFIVPLNRGSMNTLESLTICFSPSNETRETENNIMKSVLALDYPVLGHFHLVTESISLKGKQALSEFLCRHPTIKSLKLLVNDDIVVPRQRHPNSVLFDPTLLAPASFSALRSLETDSVHLMHLLNSCVESMQRLERLAVIQDYSHDNLSDNTFGRHSLPRVVDLTCTFHQTGSPKLAALIARVCFNVQVYRLTFYLDYMRIAEDEILECFRHCPQLQCIEFTTPVIVVNRNTLGRIALMPSGPRKRWAHIVPQVEAHVHAQLLRSCPNLETVVVTACNGAD